MPDQYRVTVRLPSGNEHWYLADVPKVGSLLSHQGDEYLAVAVEEGDDGSFIVTLAERPEVEAAIDQTRS